MPPKFGSKKVFLPNFTISLLRTQHLPPNYAQFIVPLNINKLDLRDYLYHAYGVEVLNVRSFITQKKIERHKPGEKATRYWRPASIKKMTVELVKPFVWPEEPTDLAPWDKETHKAIQEYREQNATLYGPTGYREPKAEVKNIRKLAQELLREKVVEEKEIEIEQELSLR
ncbi:ribosomal protein L23-domain-containing protein [Pyronema domesticum]|uniref:Large ribosomal subunit protein uL23m n=1 Tax=Pyronema omphalodes (strain CBS 100304) TaxID=1076935 RepID=U4KU59_PYROM|nr:ribosomal protein L23-domain-containing protein [Pyronema domesticum]CCX04447.1 Similar to 54S ribosomal protein L41, mitochondrial; acc. no. P32387 [Pyronema omphalodes CBS 100304]